MSYHHQLFINNERVDAKSGETLSVYNPHDSSLAADNIQEVGQADVDAAVAASRAALKGEWSKWTPQPPTAITKLLFGATSAIFRYHAGWTDKITGESYLALDGNYKIVQYDPVGVCAGIGAWNAAPVFFAYKVAPAVAAGCTCIFKASEKSPIGILQFGDLVKEAGFPPGVIQIVSGGGKTGAMLASHMDINKISFTGSVSAGKKVQELAAKSNLKRVVLELGGKSPSLIFADADFENALVHHSQGFLINSGQICVAPSRTFVHEDIAEKFVAELKPWDETTFLGPLADDKQFDRVMGFLESGKKEAKLVTGGGRHGDSGYYIEPTIFLNPKDDAKIYREEIFGPLANDTSYGLAAYIFTSSMSRALHVAKQIEAGVVSINAAGSGNIEVPTGGMKQSGLGREGGRQGIMHYLEQKMISIK
ncbi:aldehyde dehydrogenase [Byssothecium circinans]|uniref:aldehyde dehydrogenase (NAD(+)) n=1 Tax=Byssothecium circinans TaxID=147558 RepID=A0A6A5TAI7_9PLEO|nr:aldehyde dehydrogenase [Byssothecium circinans]